MKADLITLGTGSESAPGLAQYPIPSPARQQSDGPWYRTGKRSGNRRTPRNPMTPDELAKMWAAHQRTAFLLGLMVGITAAIITIALLRG